MQLAVNKDSSLSSKPKAVARGQLQQVLSHVSVHVQFDQSYVALTLLMLH